jgi:hypothetical protein
MDVSPALAPLVEPGKVVVKSDAQLAERVRIKAKELAEEHPEYGASKAIVEIPEMHGRTVDVTPFELLHEVGRATVFENRVALRDYQRLWALLRYCNAFGHNSFVRGLGERILCLTKEAFETPHHHAQTQSEYLGIGFTIVLARHLLNMRYPGWTWITVDAEVALDAGFELPRAGGRVAQRKNTSMRPDYFLLGHRAGDRRSRTRLVVLESKGTRYIGNVAKPLSKASFQLSSVRVGTKTPPGLMVSTVLGRKQIVVNMLDPEGDIDLWEGETSDVDEPLEQLTLALVPPPVEDGAAPVTMPSHQQLALVGEDAGPVVSPPSRSGNRAPLTKARIHPIPADKAGWFTRVLGHTAAAATALFAGSGRVASGLMTERQRGYGREFDVADLDQRDTGMGVCRGATHRLRWSGDQVMEIFQGLDVEALDALEHASVSEYMRRARPGAARIDGDGDEIVIRSADGAVTGFRLRSRAEGWDY